MGLTLLHNPSNGFLVQWQGRGRKKRENKESRRVGKDGVNSTCKYFLAVSNTKGAAPQT